MGRRQQRCVDSDTRAESVLTSLKPIGSFNSPVLAPFPLPDNAGQVVSARHFSSDRSLVLLLYGGDIATVQLDGPDGGVGPVSPSLVQESA